jgi:hypothetical protein
MEYIKTGNSRYISNPNPGDFNRTSEPAVYFAYDPRYTQQYIGPRGCVIEQDVPVTFIRKNGRVYETEPNDEWR